MTIREVELMPEKEYDLQEQTRRDDVYEQLTKLVADLGEIKVFPSLVWLWCWDIVSNWYKNEQWKDVHTDGFIDECFPEGLELKTIFDKFWEDCDKNGFSLEYGTEDLDEAVRDWLRECDFLVSLDEDMDNDEETNNEDE